MAAPQLPREEVERRIKAVEEHGNFRRAAVALGVNRASLVESIMMGVKRFGLTPPKAPEKSIPELEAHAGRLDLRVDNGVVIVGSDAHIWPGDPTPAMQAFAWSIDFFGSKLKAIILNGDVMDAATISKHARIGWTKRPTLLEEIKAVHKQLTALSAIAPPAARRFWTLGNHDARYENAIANGLPEFQEVQGTRLKDHFPDWEPCYSVWINDNVVVKHRFKGGVHATFNNTLYAGTSMITGHLHSLRITPFSDYHGTRWGVDTGTLSAPYTEPFIHYTEASPVNWRAGFCVLSFVRGRLMWPELVSIDGRDAVFRGELVNVPLAVRARGSA